MHQVPYALTVDVPFGHDSTVEHVTSVLAAEGFGVLTSIDFQGTMKKKLDADMPPYTILGACNPTLAHRAVKASPPMGALLPCNVVVQEVEPNRSRVYFLRPDRMFSLVERDDLGDLVEDAQAKIERAAQRLTSFMR